jgi:hypothetical protein
MDARQFELLELLTERLERLSADSQWARRASGLRGNILKFLEEADSGTKINQARIDLLVNSAFYILERAAHEIPDLDALLEKRRRIS